VLYPDGSSYSGQFARGTRHGMGVYRSSPAKQGDISGAVRVYHGEWEYGDRNGFGIEQVSMYVCMYVCMGTEIDRH
jgi:hypothetical protein